MKQYEIFEERMRHRGDCEQRSQRINSKRRGLYDKIGFNLRTLGRQMLGVPVTDVHFRSKITLVQGMS